jgi:hypothetical protein
MNLKHWQREILSREFGVAGKSQGTFRPHSKRPFTKDIPEPTTKKRLGR